MRSRFDCGVCGAPRLPGAACRPCANKANAAYKLRNAEKVKAGRSAYKKALHAAGAGLRAEKKAAKRAASIARHRAAQKAWKLSNPGAVNEATARRFASKMKATPAWADRSLMQDIYELARVYAASLGRPFHVDHVVPLRSKVVCGLHSHTNLQVLPGPDNIAKGNRRWPDMP